MPSPIALIQLISEQTMQNLVPVLALNPAKDFLLATTKTASCSANIVDAGRQAAIATEPENIRLTEMPSIPETSRAVRRSIATAKVQGHTVVNFTGGTKLMSIGQPTGQDAVNLQKRANELNAIQIITPRDLDNLEAFARRSH